MSTIAERVKASPQPFERAIAMFAYRDDQRHKVTFTFEDGSTLTFKKVYELEDCTDPERARRALR